MARIVDGMDNETIRAHIKVHSVFQQIEETEDGDSRMVWMIDYTPGSEASLARITAKLEDLVPEGWYIDGTKRKTKNSAFSKRADDPHSAIGQMSRKRWDAIRPYYEAALKGSQVDVEGTPLGTWPGIDQRRADILRQYGIRTLEELLEMPESLTIKVSSHFPDLRFYKRNAQRFIAAKDDQRAAQEIAKRDSEIDVLKNTVNELQEMMLKALNQQQAAMEDKPRRGRPAGSTRTNREADETDTPADSGAEAA